MSAAITSVWLEAAALPPEEKDIIIQAIRNHSSGKKFSSAADAALYIADKIDVSKKRNLSPKPSHARYNELSTIDDVKISIADNIITINYITNDVFLIDTNTKPYNLLISAARYLGCDCHFQINGNPS
jgi:HD superfamily phosphohydrolase YqeK